MESLKSIIGNIYIYRERERVYIYNEKFRGCADILYSICQNCFKMQQNSSAAMQPTVDAHVIDCNPTPTQQRVKIGDGDGNRQYSNMHYICVSYHHHSFLLDISLRHNTSIIATQIAKFMGPTWGPPGSCRPQMGPILAP